MSASDQPIVMTREFVMQLMSLAADVKPVLGACLCLKFDSDSIYCRSLSFNDATEGYHVTMEVWDIELAEAVGDFVLSLEDEDGPWAASVRVEAKTVAFQKSSS